MSNDINWQPGQTLEMIEKAVIQKAYRFFQNNKTKTSIALGISIRTLDAKLELYAGGNNSNGTNSQNAEPGVRLEPAQVASPEHPVSVPEREEVQSVSPRYATHGGARRHRSSL